MSAELMFKSDYDSQVSTYKAQIERGQIILADLENENIKLKGVLINLIESLEPAVHFTGVEVVWGYRDRKATSEIIKQARVLLKNNT